MLILNRGAGESIIIGDDISITVIRCSENQISIGISAPRDIRVHREEVYRRIQSKIKDSNSCDDDDGYDDDDYNNDK